MFCPKCGNEVKEGVSFCPACGTQIGESSSVVKSSVPKSKLRALFDLSFDEFITTHIIRIIYGLDIFISLMAGVAVFILMILSVRYGNVGTKILMTIAGFVVGALTSFILLLFFRVIRETMIVIFKMAEDLHIIANQNKKT